MTMTSIDSVIKMFQDIREQHGDVLVRTACQVGPGTVDFNAEVMDFYNESKTVSFKAVVIKGYREK